MNMESSLWNVANLSPPATAAVQLKVQSLQTLNVIQDFLTRLEEEKKKIALSVKVLETELSILNRFLYKLSLVFRNDKSIKMLKQIWKMTKKFVDMKIIDIIENLQEQHTVPKLHSDVFVPPKSKFEYALVRLQGATRLLAQLLCCCQHSGRLIIPTMYQGHFISIRIISMSMTARIWGMSLHLVHLLKNLYLGILRMYVSDVLPESKVDFLPKSYEIPKNLDNWLLADKSLEEAFHLLKGNAILVSNEDKRADKVEIWPSIQVDDDELDALNELKALVSQNMSSISHIKDAVLADNISGFEIDLGEPISRKRDISSSNQKQEKQAKRRKKDKKINK